MTDPARDFKSPPAAQRASALLAGTAAWTAILAAIWAPLLLQLGYGLLAHETLAILALSLPAALTLGIASRVSCTFRVGASSIALFLILDLYAVDLVNWPVAALHLVVIGAACTVGKRHIVRILAAGCAAFVAASAVAAAPSMPQPFEARAASSSRTGPPSVIHVILDEHAGPWGFPDEVLPEDSRQAQAQELAGYGLRLVAAVKASDRQTQLSLAAVANPAAGPEATPVRKGAAGATYEYELTANAYFSAMLDRGYSVRALQSSFLDLCTRELRPRVDCRTYSHNTAATLRELELRWADRALILASLMDWSLRRSRNSFLYDEIANGLAKARLDAWRSTYARWRVQPLVAAEMLDVLERSLATAGRGEHYVAHLLLPHHPYIFDEQCERLPPLEWHDIHVPTPVLSADVRIERYRRYLRQVVCTNSRIGDLMHTINANPALSDAIVIIHGDHGSRIGPWYPKDAYRGYSTADYEQDFLRVLFAVRSLGDAPADEFEEIELERAVWKTLTAAGVVSE